MAPQAQIEHLVVMGGIPGSGKTWLAERLAPAIGYPLLSRDRIKETMFDALARPADLTPLEWSNQLGAAAFATFLDLARWLGPRLILDAHFQARFGGHADVAALSMKPTQIFCHAPTTVIHRRHHERFHGRHPAHQAHGLPTVDDISAAEPFFSPLDAEGPVRVIDTSSKIDVDELAAWVLDQARA